MDGTGDELGASNTNLARIYQMLPPSDAKQITFYDPGVATGKILKPVKLFQFITGAGISKNIKKAYTFLAMNYEPGDQVYLFGFSRGAYTARSLMGLINCVHLLWPDRINQLDRAYRLYAGKAKKTKTDHFRSLHARPADIYLVGVFDTVGSLLGPFFFKTFGMLMAFMIASTFYNDLYIVVAMVIVFGFLLSPWVVKLNAFLGIHKFHNTQLCPGNVFAYHAVSIDEKRRSFKPRLWNDKDDPRVEQIWFAGTHKDIGGPSLNPETANSSLRWMMKNAQAKGLLINYQEGDLKINTGGALTPNKFPLNLFPVARGLKKHYRFHESVEQRIQLNPDYASAKRIKKLDPIFVWDLA